jgi:signal transduction histidine kinase
MKNRDKNILIIDDTVDNLKVLSEQLISEGYIVRPVTSGSLAFKTIESKMPDLILLDIKMPKMDGYEVCRRLKENENTKDIPVIFISALGETSEKTRAFEAGGVDYITKPFQASEVIARVKTHLDLYHTKKSLERMNIELKTTQSAMLQREKMASIGQLAAGVAHEINNPIGFTSGNLRTLNKYIDKFIDFIDNQSETIEKLNVKEVIEELNIKRKKLKLDYIKEDIKDLIKESLDGTERVSNIVQNLKTFSRSGEASYQKADINECIESTISIVWNELKYKGTIKKEYGEIPITICYPQELNQVFMNLLINASQAIEKQGEIVIKTWYNNKHIYISVSDTGSGIEEKIKNRIFEPFFTTKDIGRGTGLGLSIAYNIIKKHNGDVTVESQPGAGTTFTVKIPVVESHFKGGDLYD